MIFFCILGYLIPFLGKIQIFIASIINPVNRKIMFLK
jgi:hypothetical protein